MLENKWLKRVLITAPILFMAGVSVMLVGWYYIVSTNSEDIPWIMKFLGNFFFSGFLVLSITLWINEVILAWKEGKAEGKDYVDCMLRVIWLFIVNIFGAYFYGIRRISN